MRTYPNPPNYIGKSAGIKVADGSRIKFKIIDEVRHQQRTARHKCLYIQKLKRVDTGKIEFRFMYCIIGIKGKMRGKWVKTPYHPLMPKSDFEVIIKKAIKEKFIEISS